MRGDWKFPDGTVKVGTATVRGAAPSMFPQPPAAVPVVLSTHTPPKRAMQALGRLKVGTMNKTEERYAAHLDSLKALGEVSWYRFEGMKFRLADNTFYTPDFAVMLSSGALECHEVKGFWEDDARVKVKVVADQYPLRFIAVTAQNKKAGGGWSVEEF